MKIPIWRGLHRQEVLRANQKLSLFAGLMLDCVVISLDVQKQDSIEIGI